MLIDSHAHLTGEGCFAHLDELLKRAVDASLQSVINICTDSETLKRGLALQERVESPRIFNAAAPHPHDVDREGASFFAAVEAAALDGKLVAIGETGLDYHYTHSSPENQQLFLRKSMQLATSCKLPVIIHCREAFHDFFPILEEEFPTIGGVLHCFTGTLEEASRALARGFYISFSGIVTFKKSTDLQEIAKKVPPDRLLIETDAPFLAPQRQRGKPNEPAFLQETASFIAALRGISLEELGEVTSSNAKQLFRL